jgi:hypothetical protein
LLAERADGLAQEPAELVGGAGLDLVLGEVFVDELGECHLPHRPTLLAPRAFERTTQRRVRIGLRRETTALDALGSTAAGAVAKRPQRPPVATRALELEYLCHDPILARWLDVAIVDPDTCDCRALPASAGDRVQARALSV